MNIGQLLAMKIQSAVGRAARTVITCLVYDLSCPGEQTTTYKDRLQSLRINSYSTNITLHGNKWHLQRLRHTWTTSRHGKGSMVGSLFIKDALADSIAMEDGLFYSSSKTLNSCVHLRSKDVLVSRSRRSETKYERERAKRWRKRRMAIGSIYQRFMSLIFQ